jgi:hypothetical protein
MKQNTLDPMIQRLVAEEADRCFPDCTAQRPLLIALPAGIHPYNRNIAYYDHEGNAVVLYQDLGRQALRGDLAAIIPTIQHELAHWYQHHALAYTRTSTVNVHRHRTWSEACYRASVRLWPDADLEQWMFSPFTSKRVNGRPLRQQRLGALTDVELHHWPRSMPGFLAEAQGEKAHATA